MKHLLMTSFLLISSINLTYSEDVFQKIIEEDQITSIEILNHNHTPREVIVRLSPSNKTFVQNLIKILDTINSDRSENLTIDLRIFSGVELDQFKRSNIANKKATRITYVDCPGDPRDVWMRDMCKFTCIKDKTCPDDQLTIFDLNRKRSTAGLPPMLAKAHKLSYLIKKDLYRESAGNYGGNIDSTPNGVTYVGDSANDYLIKFLEKVTQNNLVVIDTRWLITEHVDEQISTILDPKDPCGFKIVYADPIGGMKTLFEKETILDFKNQIKNELKDIKEIDELSKIIDQDHPDHEKGKKAFQFNQVKAAAIITENIEKITSAALIKLKVNRPLCKSIQTIPIPVIFNCIDASYDPKRVYACHSFLPNSVNMEVLDNNLIIPDPILTSFRNLTTKNLTAASQKVFYINDIKDYHNDGGDVHCGTNTFRTLQKIIPNL